MLAAFGIRDAHVCIRVGERPPTLTRKVKRHFYTGVLEIMGRIRKRPRRWWCSWCGQEFDRAADPWVGLVSVPKDMLPRDKPLGGFYTCRLPGREALGILVAPPPNVASPMPFPVNLVTCGKDCSQRLSSFLKAGT